jgi:hypothetical protein
MNPAPDKYLYWRVVLLFKLPHTEEEIVKAFLRYRQYPESEYEENKHFIHLDPERGGDATAYIMIDINKNHVDSPDTSIIPHEIYKVKLGDDDSLYLSISGLQ